MCNNGDDLTLFELSGLKLYLLLTYLHLSFNTMALHGIFLIHLVHLLYNTWNLQIRMQCLMNEPYKEGIHKGTEVHRVIAPTSLSIRKMPSFKWLETWLMD